MKPAHQTFITQMLLHGDKFKAYRIAYPHASERSIKNAANRLMQDPQVGGLIEENARRIRAEVEAEVRAEMKANLAEEMEFKILLSQIIRRQVKIERQVKGSKNETVTLLSDPGFAMLIKAGLVLGAMEGWNMGAPSRSEARNLAVAPKGKEVATLAKESLKAVNFVPRSDEHENKEQEEPPKQTDYRDYYWVDPREIAAGIVPEIKPIKVTVRPARGIVETVEKDIKTTTIPTQGIVETIEKDIKTTTKDNKTEINECVKNDEPVQSTPALPTPPKDLPPLPLMKKAELHNAGWQSLDELIQDTFMKSLNRGQCGMKKRVKDLQELAQAMNRRDPLVYEMAPKLRLRLHPIWFHWVKEVN